LSAPDHERPIARKRGLGMGLAGLLSASAEEPGQRPLQDQPRLLPIEALEPSRHQPRRRFDPEQLEALADSLRSKGVMQPLLVRPLDGYRYEIVAGERRWRAAQQAGLHELPVLVRELSDREALEVALVENVQRQDLSPLEEALGYQRLIEEFGHTQEALGQELGKSRSHIANMLRLLGLAEPVQRMLENGELSTGHARALLGAADAVAAARTVAARGLNVRQTEALVKAQRVQPATGRPAAVEDADVRALERDLSTRLGLTVTVKRRGDGGTLSITYHSLDQLDQVLKRLT
jgi:ParB family transcriptional regulator, chromosome partitioning protein